MLDANEKYFGILEDSTTIIFYHLIDIKLNKKYYTLQFDLQIINFHLNQKYQDILLVSFQTDIELFDISQNDFNIAKPKFIFKHHSGSILSALFNPFNSHIITSSSDKTIEIWSVRKPYLKKIDCEYFPRNIKWEKKGDLLGFFDHYNLKIYDRKKNQLFIHYY